MGVRVSPEAGVRKGIEGMDGGGGVVVSFLRELLVGAGLETEDIPFDAAAAMLLKLWEAFSVPAPFPQDVLYTAALRSCRRFHGHPDSRLSFPDLLRLLCHLWMPKP